MPEETLLDNERVLVRRLVAGSGRIVELPDCPLPQLLVVIKGGSLTTTRGRVTVWPAGRVVWLAGSEPSPAGRLNEGPGPLEFVHICLKAQAHPAVADQAGVSRDRYLNYPNIPGEDVFENEWVIVQRFKVDAGQWEGIHEHVPNMLFVHVTGGRWAVRSIRDGEHVYPDASGDGTVGWMHTIDLAAGHESGNVGENQIDLIWLTLKG